MARVASTSTAVGIPRVRTYSINPHQQPPQFVNFNFRNTNRRRNRLYCQPNDPNPVDSAQTEEKVESKTDGTSPSGTDAKETSSSTSSGFPEFPDRSINRRVAVGSTVAAVGLFVSKRLDFSGGGSLKDLTAVAMPYEQALSNGKPTVVEFYADWCEVCRELAPDVYKVEQKYKGQVNFVMLNVDNTKWEQELDEFGVEGIPHFAFLDKEGNEEGNITGRLPRQYLLENVDALAQGETTIPHARVVGQFSRAESRKVRPVTDPRSHG